MHGPTTREPRGWALGLPVDWRAILLAAACQVMWGCAWLDQVTGNPRRTAHSLLEEAHQAEQAGEIAQAGLLFRQAIDANPEDETAHRELARLLLEQGDTDGAVEQLRLAVRQRDDDVESYVQLARIQLDHGKPDGAEREIDAALAIDPHHVESLLLKAELAELRGEDELAMETYFRVLARDPENAGARQRAAEMQIAAGRPERAAPLLRAICECKAASQEQRAEAQWSLGIVYGQQNRWSDAAEALAAAADKRPGMSADDWYRLAYARFAAGDLEGARQVNQRALRLQPAHPRAVAMSDSLRRSVQAHGLQRTAMVVPRPAGW